MVEGPNFRFGRGRSGTVELLAELTAAAGMTLEVVEPVVIDGAIVSSSRVRQLISAGRIDEASRLLTRPYRIRGMVVHGAGRGVKIGFPTANIDAVDTLLPGAGVYAGRAWVGATSAAAAINIGPNPTFGEHAVKVEVHLIDWQEPLYGQPLEVDFLARLRDIQRFPRVEELKNQLQLDIQRARALASDKNA
jgi:riboflavin kinase/FMN adenylyltransferase